MNQIDDSLEPVTLAAASVEGSAAATAERSSKSLGKLLFSGSSALGAATLIERGFGFLANLAAARLGGPQVFGAYSIAMTTANNVASYAGGGIGTTANRFSGEYPYGSPGYAGLLRTMSVVCLGSATLAVIALWFAAEPIAVHLIRNPGLTGLLRLASISAGAIILLECLRGLLIGQRRFLGLLSLSALFGLGMLIGLPLAARYSPSEMLICQSVVATGAIFVCVLLARQLEFTPPAGRLREGGPTVGTVLRFGMVQLAGMVGLNAAGWWVASMVARADISLIQAGWFSVGMQMRNMCAMPAGLISQTAYAQLTESGGEGYGGADRVTVISTMAAVFISLAVAGPAAALMPWLVSGLYGHAFGGAELAATLAVATGLVHMSGAPAANRLTVVSLTYTGMINACWSVLLFVLGTWLVPGGGAAAAASCFLAAHLFSALAVVGVLLKRGAASRELIYVTVPAWIGALLIAVCGRMRVYGHQKVAFSGLLLLATAALLAYSYYHGRTISAALRELTFAKALSLLAGRARRSLPGFKPSVFRLMPSSNQQAAAAAAPAPQPSHAAAPSPAVSPTRVALVLYRDDLNVGGSLRVVEILAHALDRSRVEAHIVFTYGGPGPISNHATVPCHFLHANGPLDLKAWRRARVSMAEINPKIIHFHNPAYWLHAALTGQNYKKLVHLHGPFFPSQMSGFDRWLKRQTGRIADAMVCITRDMRQMVVREKWGAPEQVWTVYNGIDCVAPQTAPSKAEARRQLGLPAKAKVLGVVCRLAWYKGCGDGIRVLERLPGDWHLLFCGDGPMKSYLEDLAARSRLTERTHFAGMVDDMRVAYSAMDAFLFTSKLEPFGLVIAEAMAARVPVFGFAAEGAYRDEFYPLITPRNSVFVERSSPGDYISPEPAAVVDALARYIVRYGDHPEEFRAMIDHAQQWVIDRFDSKVQAEAMLEIYDYVLGRQTDAPK